MAPYRFSKMDRKLASTLVASSERAEPASSDRSRATWGSISGTGSNLSSRPLAPLADHPRPGDQSASAYHPLLTQGQVRAKARRAAVIDEAAISLGAIAFTAAT